MPSPTPRRRSPMASRPTRNNRRRRPGRSDRATLTLTTGGVGMAAPGPGWQPTTVPTRGSSLGTATMPTAGSRPCSRSRRRATTTLTPMTSGTPTEGRRRVRDAAGSSRSNSQAICTARNSSGSPPWSGWVSRARCLYAARMSSAVASGVTPRTAYGSKDAEMGSPRRTRAPHAQVTSRTSAGAVTVAPHDAHVAFIGWGLVSWRMRHRPMWGNTP